jgi:hypothetical protein
VAQAIVTEGLRNLAAGANPMLLKRGIDAGTRAVVDEIKKLSIPVKGHSDIAHIARHCRQRFRDRPAARAAMEKVGHDGVISGTSDLLPVLEKASANRRKEMLRDLATLTVQRSYPRRSASNWRMPDSKT